MQAANSEEIIKAVGGCPSQALSYLKNNEGENTEIEEVADVQVKPQKNGPLIIEGNFSVLDSENNIVKSADKAALCRCGGSKNKPFCDGTHKHIGFEG